METGNPASCSKIKLHTIGFAPLFVYCFLKARGNGPEGAARALRRLGKMLKPWISEKFRARPETLARAIDASYKMLPIPIRCLEQSLVTWFVFNLNEHPAHLKIGVQLTPLYSHAWVESEGQTYVPSPFIPDLHVVAAYGPF